WRVTEAAEGNGEPHPDLGWWWRVVERGLQVGVLGLQTVKPAILRWAGQFWRRFFRQRQAPREMARPHDIAFTAFLQPFQTIVSDGLQHGKTRLDRKSTRLNSSH